MLHQQSWFLIFNFLFGNNFNLSKDSRKSIVQITSWYFVKKIHLLQLFDLIWLITSSSSLSPCFCMFSSVTQSCPTLCDPMDCSTPDFSVHQLAQTHVHWVGDAIQPYHPLSSPSPPPSIFPSIRVLCIRWPKNWSFRFSINLSNEYQDWFLLIWTSWIFLQSRGLSRVFSNTTVQKHQFFEAFFIV